MTTNETGKTLPCPCCDRMVSLDRYRETIAATRRLGFGALADSMEKELEKAEGGPP